MRWRKGDDAAAPFGEGEFGIEWPAGRKRKEERFGEFAEERGPLGRSAFEREKRAQPSMT